FFFQAEDGIRDLIVTGVQTCALPISSASACAGLTAEAAIERVRQRMQMRMREIDDPLLRDRMHDLDDLSDRLLRIVSGRLGTARSEERRVGKECRSQWSPHE